MPEIIPEKLKYSEEDLIILLKARNNAAFGYLYDNYSGALFRTIKLIIRNEESAADVLQEVFLQIWKQIHTYDPSKSRLFTWMLAISKNAAIDATRSKSFHNQLSNDCYTEEMVKHTQSLVTAPETDHIHFDKILKSLKRNYSKLIELSFLKGFTHDEIAILENIPVGTVKTRIRYGLKQLKKFCEMEAMRFELAIE